MVFDAARDVAVLFGGNGLDGHPVDSTREWNGVMWENPQGGGTGIALQQHAMAFDLARGVTVLFGGDDGFDFTELVDYTFEYDGTAWTYIELAQCPPVRQKHVMAYDQERGVVVLFGGSGSTGVLGETWEYDGTAWVERKMAGPDKRTEAAMVYDADRGVCVLFGGVGEGGTLDDTWEYDGATWTLVDTPARPPARSAHAMTYDTARREILLYGGRSIDNQVLGDTWVFRCEPACFPDFDGDGDLTLFDFLAFVNAFNAATPNADCDGDGSLDLFDFLCYTNKFNAGC